MKDHKVPDNYQERVLDAQSCCHSLIIAVVVAAAAAVNKSNHEERHD
jgi:hypothetical protein